MSDKNKNVVFNDAYVRVEDVLYPFASVVAHKPGGPGETIIVQHKDGKEISIAVEYEDYKTAYKRWQADRHARVRSASSERGPAEVPHSHTGGFYMPGVS